MNAPLLTLSEVRRTYHLGQTTVQALRSVSLNIAAGEMVAVWGPSGSGKSTLLNMLGLIDSPDAGKLHFDGVDISTLSDDALADLRNHKVGFVFQAFNLVPVFSALENVMLPLHVMGINRNEAKERASDWLKKVGLEAFMHHRPDRLSGGQRQRVAIARALVTKPRLVIADEPTANLDSENSALVLDLLWDMSRNEHVTCLFASHDPRLIERAERLVLLRDGVIVEDRAMETKQSGRSQ
ncbi:MAG TPA: ABC transporter ATP-binding protein [Rhodocyclaceae bacterium]|jgi:putative ABC transport system ATP-binding protein|nr:ABC transporter ATP-binding protein [Rhodocyclaceae bacterium]